MRYLILAVVFAVSLAVGCSPPLSSAPTATQPSSPVPGSDADTKEATSIIPDLPEVQPVVFASWPSVTPKAVQIGPTDWTVCAIGPPPEWQRERKSARESSGPHAAYAIIVRVSPNADTLFREGGTLPAGTIVVKEKHKVNDLSETSVFNAYAFMIKREAGYDEANGDWEYGFVTLRPDRSVTRGRLAECLSCHAKASEHDYLFRRYLADSN